MAVIMGKCGTDCSACQFKEKFHCGGCPAQGGKLFWGECSVFSCAFEKGLSHCGMCKNFPCASLTELITNGHNPDRMTNLLKWKSQK